MKNPFTYIKSMPGLKSGNIRIAIGGFIAICLVGIIYILQADNIGNGKQSEEKNTNTNFSAAGSTVMDIANVAPNIKQSESITPEKHDASQVEASKPVVMRTDQVTTPQQQDPNTQQLEQIKQQAKSKQLQAYYAAYGSKSTMGTPTQKANSSNPIAANPVTSDGAGESGGQVNDTNSPYLNSELITPKSPYLVQAGSILPAVMISGLNSDISGQVIAQIRENVYDSASGRYLLIPQGSKLIGQFSNQIAYGQDRIAVAWQRVIYPSGNSISLKGMQGSDVAGFAGFSDQVDNHYWRIFGASFVMGVITAGMQYSQNNTNSNVQTGGYGFTNPNPSVGQTLSGSLGQQLGQTGMMITQKNLNIAPTITIRQGYKFTIMMTADVALKPYKQGN